MCELPGTLELWFAITQWETSCARFCLSELSRRIEAAKLQSAQIIRSRL